MDAQDIIDANPTYTFGTPFRIGEMDAMSVTYGDSAITGGVIWQGNIAVWVDDISQTSLLSHAANSVRFAQPGKEFATVWDDEIAARLRSQGISVYRTANGGVLSGFNTAKVGS